MMSYYYWVEKGLEMWECEYIMPNETIPVGITTGGIPPSLLWVLSQWIFVILFLLATYFIFRAIVYIIMYKIKKKPIGWHVKMLVGALVVFLLNIAIQWLYPIVGLSKY